MSDQMTASQRLTYLGIELPASSPPAANYVPYKRVGQQVFISGQICMWNGELRHTGTIGRDLSLDQGYEAARLCGVNMIKQLQDACAGDLDRVSECVKLSIFVQSSSDFKDQPKVANGVSDLMIQVFGDEGRHARAAVGVNALPLNAAVEVEGLFLCD